MGTSASYGGPGKGGSLLPPWAPQAPAAGGEGTQGTDGSTAGSGQDGSVQPSVTWGAAKARLTRFATSGGTQTRAGRTHLRRAGRYFVRAQGGGRRAARAATAGRATARRLIGFLGAVVARGPEVAAREFGLEGFLGQSVEILLAAIVDRIAPEGGRLEQAAARAALTETLSEVLREKGVADEGIEALQGLTRDDATSILERFVARYIDQRLIQVLAKTLENLPNVEVIQREKEVWEYVKNTVRLDLASLDVLRVDWNGIEGKIIIERIFTEAYKLLEMK